MTLSYQRAGGLTGAQGAILCGSDIAHGRETFPGWPWPGVSVSKVKKAGVGQQDPAQAGSGCTAHSQRNSPVPAPQAPLLTPFSSSPRGEEKHFWSELLKQIHRWDQLLPMPIKNPRSSWPLEAGPLFLPQPHSNAHSGVQAAGG